MPEPFYPAALQLPGPTAKTGYTLNNRNAGAGVIVHSAEGFEVGLFSRLLGSDPVSWHFTCMQDGRVFQHYGLEFVCWHAKAPANYNYVGIECEGVAGQTLTQHQLDALVQLIAWIGGQFGWREYSRQTTLREHNEFVATACPSGRIPWALVIGALQPSLAAPDPVPASPPPAGTGSEVPPAVFDRRRQQDALTAAAFVLSIGHPVSDLGPEDVAALKYFTGQLP